MGKKISKLVEEIFSLAVSMDQSGKLRNSIYAIKNKIYILNSDSTVLLRFFLRKFETPFDHPVAFRANDYDSREFEERDGNIVFITKEGGYLREKSCRIPDSTPEEIEKLYLSYDTEEADNEVIIPKTILSLLEDGLSHIEFRGENGKLYMVQRDIYSGSIIEISKDKSASGFGIDVDKKISDFGPIGIRTNDFTSLFIFQDQVNFNFFNDDKSDYIYIKGLSNTVNMSGFISCCRYDELSNITRSQEVEDGREEQKVRRSK